MAAQPMPEGFLPGGIYEEVQFSQLGLPDINGKRTNLGPWRQAFQFLRHSLGFVRQQVWKSQAMAPDVLREKAVEVH